MMNLSQSEFSDLIKIKRGNITTILNSDSKNISSTIILALAENLPDLNIRWYLTGKGKMFKSDKSKREEELENLLQRKIDVIEELKSIFLGQRKETL